MKESYTSLWEAFKNNNHFMPMPTPPLLRNRPPPQLLCPAPGPDSDTGHWCTRDPPVLQGPQPGDDRQAHTFILMCHNNSHNCYFLSNVSDCWLDCNSDIYLEGRGSAVQYLEGRGRLHQFQLFLWPSCRGGPEDSKTPPACKIRFILSQDMAI